MFYFSVSVSVFVVHFQLKSASNLQLSRLFRVVLLFAVFVLVSSCRKCNQMCAHATHFKSHCPSPIPIPIPIPIPSLIIGIVNIRQSLAKIKSAEWSLSRRPAPLWSFLRLNNPTNPKRDNVARLTWHSPNSSENNIPDLNLYGLIK